MNGGMDGGPKSWPRFHSTFDIIEAVEGGRFPERVMMTFHPQRWTDSPVEWTRPSETLLRRMPSPCFTG